MIETLIPVFLDLYWPVNQSIMSSFGSIALDNFIWTFFLAFAFISSWNCFLVSWWQFSLHHSRVRWLFQWDFFSLNGVEECKIKTLKKEELNLLNGLFNGLYIWLCLCLQWFIYLTLSFVFNGLYIWLCLCLQWFIYLTLSLSSMVYISDSVFETERHFFLQINVFVSVLRSWPYKMSGFK